MFTIIFEKGRKKKEVHTKDNGLYLCQSNQQKYHLLSQLDSEDIDVFSSLDMPLLIKELKEVSTTLEDADLKHINDIILLAEECAKFKKSTLTFNPFIGNIV